MKKLFFKIFVSLCCFALLLSGCEADSYKAFMSIESSTKTSWSQSHHFFEGTKGHILNLGKEPQEMEIEVVTEEGRIDITVTEKSGKEIIVLEDAKTGTYEFTAAGKIRIKVEAKEHRGSFEIKKANS